MTFLGNRRDVTAGSVGGVGLLFAAGNEWDTPDFDTTLLTNGVHRMRLEFPGRGPVDSLVEIRNETAPPPPMAGRLPEVPLPYLPRASPPLPSRASIGATASDVDGDGDLDLIAWSSSELTIYRQTGPWRFEPAQSMSLLVSVIGAADLDGDGLPEIVVGGFGLHLLRLVDGVFTDVSAAAGWLPWQELLGWRGVTFSDVDADGLLDVAIARMDCKGTPSVFFRNEGGLHFRDIAPTLGLDFPYAATFALALDRPVRGGPLLATGMFETCTVESIPDALWFYATGADLPTRTGQLRPPNQGAYMGTAWLDADGDGRLDLWVTMTSENPLLLAPGFMTEASARYGLQSFPGVGGQSIEQWAIAQLDLDLDGRGDLLVTQLRADVNDLSMRPHPRLLWRGPSGPFRDVSTAAGLDEPVPCDALQAADLDGDGDADLILGCRDRIRVLRNDVAPSRVGRTLVLRGTVSNSEGVDAHVRVGRGEARLVRGGGQPGGTAVDRLSVRADDAATIAWPSGLDQTVAVGTSPTLVVTEPEVVRLERRWVEHGAARAVGIEVHPGRMGTPDAVVRVGLDHAAWEEFPQAKSDGVWRGAIRVPPPPATVTVTVTIGSTTLAVRPRLYVR